MQASQLIKAREKSKARKAAIGQLNVAVLRLKAENDRLTHRKNELSNDVFKLNKRLMVATEERDLFEYALAVGKRQDS